MWGWALAYVLACAQPNCGRISDEEVQLCHPLLINCGDLSHLPKHGYRIELCCCKSDEKMVPQPRRRSRSITLKANGYDCARPRPVEPNPTQTSRPPNRHPRALSTTKNTHNPTQCCARSYGYLACRRHARCLPGGASTRCLPCRTTSRMVFPACYRLMGTRWRGRNTRA